MFGAERVSLSRHLPRTKSEQRWRQLILCGMVAICGEGHVKGLLTRNENGIGKLRQQGRP